MAERIPPLPSPNEWQFIKIDASEHERAVALQAAGSPSKLVHHLTEELAAALSSLEVRFGREQDSKCPDNCRIVIQFRVPDDLFDWFLNARTGYRSHYRASAQRGMAFNDEIVGSLRALLAMRLPGTVMGRLLAKGLRDLGPLPSRGISSLVR